MSSIRAVTEEFIRLVKREIHDSAVLAGSDDVFEVKRTPSVILQRPMLAEDGARQTQARFVE